MKENYLKFVKGIGLSYIYDIGSPISYVIYLCIFAEPVSLGNLLQYLLRESCI